MKLLIVEDDEQMRHTLIDLLAKDYLVDAASSAEEALKLVEVNDYDLCIVDYVLPTLTGVQFVESLRKTKNNSLVLFLTGVDESQTKILALDAGGDDYLVKPFSLPELQARIRALLRRTPARLLSNVITVGDLTINLAQKTVKRNGKEIALRRKEFDLLEYLARNEGKVLTRTMILDHVWDSSYDTFTNIVDVHINYLREQIDKNQPHKIIKTVHGVGYKLDASLS